MDWLAIDWPKLIERLGFPTAVALALGLFIFWVARWFGQKVVEPIVAGHTRFLDSTVNLQERNQQTQERTLECVKSISEQVTRQTDLVSRIGGIKTA